jgi:hypothetical protein
VNVSRSRGTGTGLELQGRNPIMNLGKSGNQFGPYWIGTVNVAGAFHEGSTGLAGAPGVPEIFVDFLASILTIDSR